MIKKIEFMASVQFLNPGQKTRKSFTVCPPKHENLKTT